MVSMTRSQRQAMASKASPRTPLLVAAWAAMLVLTACQPHDQRPGLWLRGTVVETLPEDWAFTDEHHEIYVEVQTPYFIPHSVTIWCAQVDGQLYIGARDPASKRWPAWMTARPNVRLKIGELLYKGSTTEVHNPETIETIKAAYRKKYALQQTASTIKYWAVK